MNPLFALPEQLAQEALNQIETERQLQVAITLLITNEMFRQEIYNLFLQ
jgi:hypothetical protein